MGEGNSPFAHPFHNVGKFLNGTKAGAWHPTSHSSQPEQSSTLIVAVVVAMIASASEAQLDSCEGCLTTLAQVADWGQENIDVRNKAWDIF